MYIDVLKHYDFTSKFKSLSNEEKKQLGFNIHDDGSICYFKDIEFTLPNDREFGISFELEIDKDGNSSYFLLDECGGQPVCGELKPGTQYCYDVETQTKAIIEDLVVKGVIEKTSDYKEPVIIPVDNSQPEEIKDKEVHWAENGTFGGIIKGGSRENVDFDGDYENDLEPNWYIGVSHNKQEALDLLHSYFPIEKTKMYKVVLYDRNNARYYLCSEPEYENTFEDQITDLEFLADRFESEMEAEQAIRDLMQDCKLNNLSIEHYLFDNGYSAEVEEYEDIYCPLDLCYIEDEVNEAYTKNYKPKQDIKFRTEYYPFKILSEQKMNELGYTKWGHSYKKRVVIDMDRSLTYESIIDIDHNHYEYIINSLTQEEIFRTEPEDAIIISKFIDNEVKFLADKGVIE